MAIVLGTGLYSMDTMAVGMDQCGCGYGPLWLWVWATVAVGLMAFFG